MIFNFLRKYFKDDEFEQTKIELAETRQLLKEYKEFLTEMKSDKTNNDVEKVDPDFINLMWVSVGFAIVIFVDAGREAVILKGESNNLTFYVWVSLALFSLYFIIANGFNSIRLTSKYVKQKQDPIYKTYEWYLRVGAILIFTSILALVFLSK